MLTTDRLIQLEDYEPLVGAEMVDRVRRKAHALRGTRVVHVNSTYYGGGVAEMLSSLTLLMNAVGIRTDWRTIQGSPDFFSITKTMHNALQGLDVTITGRMRQIYEDVILENAIRMRLDEDFVVVHDPQPLPLITHYRKKGPWIWRCHVEVANPDSEVWDYLKGFVERYDAVIFSLEKYAQPLSVPQLFFMPAIDPFAIKNKELTPQEIDERLAHYGIPTDLPLVVQISRFDRWKDPEGVVQAFKLASREVDARLVLLGNTATDDPEGQQVFESVLRHQSDRIIILSRQDSSLVNALQRQAAVVLQKSVREGFGLTVTEAMWKGTPVIGGNTGGIPAQIRDGVNGFLVSSVEETADRIVLLLKNPALRRRMGDNARETVRRHFLLIRLVERYLDLFASFETVFRLNGSVVTA